MQRDHSQSLKHSAISRSVVFKKRRATAADAPTSITLIIRPVSPDDSLRQEEVVKRMNPNSRYLRFFAQKDKLSDEEVYYFTHINYKTSFALAALDPVTDDFVGIARYMEDDVAVLVVDEFQGYGIGRYLIEYLFEIAKARGKEHLHATILRQNRASCGCFDYMSQKYACVVERDYQEVIYRYHLNEPPQAPDEAVLEYDPTRKSKIARIVSFPFLSKSGDLRPDKTLIIRPTSLDDMYREAECIKKMSDMSTLYEDIFKMQQEDKHPLQFSQIDYSAEFALAAVDPVSDEFLAIARYIEDEDENRTVCAVLLHDAYRGYGLGKYLMNYLFEIGKREGKDKIIAEVLESNHGGNQCFSDLAKKHWCRVTKGPVISYEFHLQGDPVESPPQPRLDLSQDQENKTHLIL